MKFFGTIFFLLVSSSLSFANFDQPRPVSLLEDDQLDKGAIFGTSMTSETVTDLYFVVSLPAVGNEETPWNADEADSAKVRKVWFKSSISALFNLDKESGDRGSLRYIDSLLIVRLSEEETKDAIKEYTRWVPIRLSNRNEKEGNLFRVEAYVAGKGITKESRLSKSDWIGFGRLGADALGLEYIRVKQAGGREKDYAGIQILRFHLEGGVKREISEESSLSGSVGLVFGSGPIAQVQKSVNTYVRFTDWQSFGDAEAFTKLQYRLESKYVDFTFSAQLGVSFGGNLFFDKEDEMIAARKDGVANAIGDGSEGGGRGDEDARGGWDGLVGSGGGGARQSKPYLLLGIGGRF